MRFFFVIGFALLCCVFGVWRVQAMGSASYQIPWDSLNTGGNEQSTSTNYGLYDTIGQTASGLAASTNYQLQSGYRAESDVFRLSFIAEGQSADFSTRYAQISNTHPRHVVVSSTVGLAEGDYIAAVQNGGYAGLVAIGKVIWVDSGMVIVDRWEGDIALMDGFSSDSNDYVYKLDSSTVPLGSITAGAERVGLVGGSVISSASSGHTVYVQADGDLTLLSDAGESIAPVTDGAVSSEAEEYGAEAIGTYAVSPGTDLAVTSTQRAIISSTVPAPTDPDRFLLLFKLGVTSSTVVGDYYQTVYFTLTSNF